MNWHEDKTLIVLAVMVFFFTGMTALAVHTRPEDTQYYQLFSGLLTGFGGALLIHLTGIKGPSPPKPPDKPGA
jgi:hypothetical protein